MQIQKYEKPASVAEAYELLKREKSAAIVGGGAYLRLSRRRIGCAIDLYETGLDFVREKGKGLEIGAMATFRRLETDPLIRESNDALLALCVRDVVGVQLRNLVTVGGSVAGKYGFSNLITALLALDARVTLHGAQVLGMAEYLERKRDPLDLVTGVIVPRRDLRACFQSIQKTRTDYSMLNVAVTRRENRCRIAVGARPGVARLASKAMHHMETAFAGVSGRSKTADAARSAFAAEAARLASAELHFGDDVRASSWYRRQVCEPLVRRAIEEVTR